MTRFLIIYITLFLILFLTVIIGEFLANRLPKSIFNKWWKQNVIRRCEECE